MFGCVLYRLSRARENELTWFPSLINFVSRQVPEQRRLLPFIHKARCLAIEQTFRVYPKCRRHIGIDIHPEHALREPLRRLRLAATFDTLDCDTPAEEQGV